ncbi:MAG: hypothetical protein JSR80_07715 [Verrucomicrobia bacterium]|nr:hypothetical protein [Verrucomicrobiota bacterium]
MERVKAPGSDDLNQPNITNIEQDEIIESRELSRSSKTNSVGYLGIDWKQELQLNDAQLQDMRLLAYTYQTQGKYERAIALFEALLLLDEATLYHRQAIGALYLQTGKHEKALEELVLAHRANPRHLPTRLNLAKVFLGLGKKQEGLKMAKSLLKVRNPQIASLATALLMAHGEEAVPEPELHLLPSSPKRASVPDPELPMIRLIS